MVKLIQDKDNYTLCVLKNDSHISSWVEQHRSMVTDQTVTLHILPMIKAGDTVVDVGANIGTHTVQYAKAVGETGKVLAFEPYVPSFICLAVNTRDLPQVELFNSALGAESCKGSVIAPKDTNMGMASVVKDNNGLTLVYPLDDLNLESCAFIKIDVEGSEPDAIKGAMETIKRCQPVLFVELNDTTLEKHGYTKDSVLKPLMDIGYQYSFVDPCHSLHETQLDVILKP